MLWTQCYFSHDIEPSIFKNKQGSKLLHSPSLWICTFLGLMLEHLENLGSFGLMNIFIFVSGKQKCWHSFIASFFKSVNCCNYCAEDQIKWSNCVQYVMLNCNYHFCGHYWNNKSSQWSWCLDYLFYLLFYNKDH